MPETRRITGLLTSLGGTYRIADWAYFAVYVLVLLGAAIHLYRQPIYDMDSIQYMGNALLMEETDPVKVHARVYAELERYVPEDIREQLLGKGAVSEIGRE